jgi:VanZ family protein
MIRKNILSIVAALVILYLSLANSHTFDKIDVFHFSGMDKVVHFGMYAVFMGIILYENRKRIKTRNRLFLLVLIPSFYGALMELFQSWFTTTRAGSIYDLLFDVFGTVFTIAIYLLVRNSKREKIR